MQLNSSSVNVHICYERKGVDAVGGPDGFVLLLDDALVGGCVSSCDWGQFWIGRRTSLTVRHLDVIE